MTSKYKRKGKQPFLMLEAYIIRSAAWKATKPDERAAYLELKWRYKGTNNGMIGLSARDLAKAINVGKNTANAALKALEEKGLIAVTTKGGFNVKIGRATEWRLTEYKCDVTGQIATKEFMRWSPEKQNTVLFEIHTVPPEVHQASKNRQKIA